MENLTVVLEAVSKRYGGGPEPVAALREVTLDIPAGEFVAILGPSGSGKSTLLNLIAGLDSPTAGRVLVGGRDLAYLGDGARSDLRLREIGFVFQSFNLFPTFTAEENVAWPLEFQGLGWREARRRAQATLAQVGLPPAVAPRRPAQLSGGEQQRVAIARALVTEPRLLLADEPTGNLDSQTGQTILDLLRRLNAERRLTVVLVTHNTLAASHAQRTVELRDGRVVREARGTITIMFSDIVGFTAMTERLGDVRTQEILHTHCAIVREQIAVHGGFEVKTQGDGFMIAFGSARRALRCAVAIQRAMAAYDEHAEAPVRLRIGLHTGEVTKEGYDFFGRSVIVAARIAAAAQGGEILVSSLVRELTGGAEEFAFDGGRELELKGLRGLHRLFAVNWEAGRDSARAERVHAEERDGNGVAPAHPVASFPRLAAQLR
ncbi:MAG TPA: ATP-binding cassette domain-containing protein [Candidatus Limnocylindria bacterium]|nr:ATP-binding cassette domain-containing protein [Candidatus Limnocylindria bacterium]